MPELEVRIKNRPSQILRLVDGELVVGRGDGCGLRLPDDLKPISKRHLLLDSAKDMQLPASPWPPNGAVAAGAVEHWTRLSSHHTRPQTSSIPT